MKRRTFIKGAVATAVAVSLPSFADDGVSLQCVAHPQIIKYGQRELFLFGTETIEIEIPDPYLTDPDAWYLAPRGTWLR